MEGGENIKILDFVTSLLNPKKYGGKSAKTIVADLKEEIYFRELAFHTAISYAANGVAKCEFKTYKNNEEIREGDYYTLNYSPNINQNSSQFWHKVIEQLFYKGEALVIPKSDGTLYCADSYGEEPYPFLGNKYTGIVIDGFQLDRSYHASEVFLFKLDNAELKKLVDGLYHSYGKMLAYAMKSYGKSNAEKYKLHIDDQKAGDEEFNEEYNDYIEGELKNFISSNEAVYPEFEGYELSDMTPKNNVKDSSDIRNLRKDIFETVAQAVKIPLALMTGNITNITEIANAFVSFTIEPITEMIAEELTRKNGYSNWKSGNFIEVDTSMIKHKDIFELADSVEKFIGSGVFCVDEVRGLLKHRPLGTEFSKTHFVTKNFDTAENSLKGDIKK